MKMQTIELENGIPIPERKGKQFVFPQLYTMEVNQSFTCPLEDYARLHTASQNCRRKTGRKFTLRKMYGNARIWRIE
jgi:hypothetical protein